MIPPEGPSKVDASPWFAELDDTQIGAIKATLGYGLEIQRQIPQIADDYKNGISKRELVEKYQIQDRFGIEHPLTAENAVGRALFGYDGGFNFPNIEPFPGLIPDPEERKELAKQHKIKTGKKAVEDKTGVHAWTFKERSELGKRNITEAGFTPYSEEEKLRIAELAASPEYRLKYGKGDRVSTKKIAAQINVEFHGGKSLRTPDAIVDVVQNLKKPTKE